MKTPIQELMDEFAKKADSLPDTLDANAAYLAFQECYDMAKSMLNKEMAVIIEAFHEGMRFQGWDPNRGIAEEYYSETFNTNREMNQCKCTAPTIATKVSENGIYSYCTKCAEEVETFNTNQENLPDSTNGYTYYPQENKTVFNTKEK